MIQPIPEPKTGLARIIAAARYSRDGLIAAFKGEAAFRQLVAGYIILIPLAFFLPVTAFERALMITVCLASLIIELLNSAIEAIVDLVSPNFHPLAKNAKDMGSAAQFIGMIMVALVWCVILYGHYSAT